MKCLGYYFNDMITGKGIYEYSDKYGDRYLANYPFMFWSYRVKKIKKENERQDNKY